MTYVVSTEALKELVIGYTTLELDGKLWVDIVEDIAKLEELVLLKIESTVAEVALTEVDTTEGEVVEEEVSVTLAEEEEIDDDLTKEEGLATDEL